MNALIKKIIIKAQLEALSGLHIGGSNMGMAIGGADAVVVRNPITQEPYIPGSSLKGKMRSLSERLYGKTSYMQEKIPNGPFKDDPNHIICKLYGTALGNENNIPSRILVRDAHLVPDSEKALGESQHTDMLYTEVKTEVVIDRVTAVADLRQLERVPAGAKFEVEIALNVYEGDDEQALMNHVAVGLRLLEDDYIGGKGSRGSGQVRFDRDTIDLNYKDISVYEGDGVAKPYTGIDQLLPA